MGGRGGGGVGPDKMYPNIVCFPKLIEKNLKNTSDVLFFVFFFFISFFFIRNFFKPTELPK